MTEVGSDRKIHIRLSEDTHRQLRVRCAELDVTMQEYVTGLIEVSLGLTAKKAKNRRRTGTRQ